MEQVSKFEPELIRINQLIEQILETAEPLKGHIDTNNLTFEQNLMQCVAFRVTCPANEWLQYMQRHVDRHRLRVNAIAKLTAEEKNILGIVP